MQQICASHFSKSMTRYQSDKNSCPHGAYIPWFNIYTILTTVIEGHYCRWGNWDFKKLSNLLKVTELVTNGPKFKSSSVQLQSLSFPPALLHYILWATEKRFWGSAHLLQLRCIFSTKEYSFLVCGKQTTTYQGGSNSVLCADQQAGSHSSKIYEPGMCQTVDQFLGI